MVAAQSILGVDYIHICQTVSKLFIHRFVIWAAFFISWLPDPPPMELFDNTWDDGENAG